MHRRRNRLFGSLILALAAGTCLQLNGCLGEAAKYAANFNPCGTILNCNYNQYRYAQYGYEGPGADPDFDPFCTWPPYCGGEVDPVGSY